MDNLSGSFLFRVFNSDKIGSWKLIFKKGKQYLESKGVEYEELKDEMKKFFYGDSEKPKNQVRLQKNCEKCQKPLIYLREIKTYNSGLFECDKCAATNLISGGVHHCNECQYDLCEECNDETMIHCGGCKKGMLKMKKGKNTCFVCSGVFVVEKNKSYVCSEKDCKFNMCVQCKARR